MERQESGGWTSIIQKTAVEASRRLGGFPSSLPRLQPPGAPLGSALHGPRRPVFAPQTRGG
jgi:hypothetical protein